MSKIVLFAYAFPPNQGGGEQYNFTLATGLTKMGQDIYVVTPQKGKVIDNYLFPLIRLRSGLIRSFFDLNKAMKEIRPDLFHISGPTPIDFFLILLAKTHRAKTILTYHGDFPSNLGRLLNKLIFLFQKGYSVILVQTERDKQNLRKRGVNENRIITFPFNGIDRNIFKIKRNSIRDIDMLFIGRMDKEHSYKGYWILLDIIREIKKIKGDRVSITVVGGGSDFSYFFKKSIEEKLNLNFLTDISDEDLVLILNRAKTIILPSTSNSEGFGRVVLEAIFCGVVPIVSKYAGSSEVINEYNSGIVIDPFNIKDTQFAIIDLLDNDQKLHEFKMNMIKMLENGTFTVDWTISKTLEIYSQIVKEKKSYNNLP